MQALLWMYLIGGLGMALIALPLIAEKIKPNPFYGFRVPATLKNPKLWYDVNKYFAKRLLVVGLVFSLAALGLYFWPGISVDAYALICLGILVVLFAPATIQSWQYMNSKKP